MHAATTHSRPPYRPAVDCASRRRRDDYDFDPSWRSSSGRKQRQQRFTMRINGREVEVPDDALWRLALPAAGLLGIAAFLGPLVITAAIGALAVGAAVATAGFAMTAMFFPFLIMAGVGAVFTLGSFFTLGAMFVLPKIIATMALVS